MMSNRFMVSILKLHMQVATSIQISKRIKCGVKEVWNCVLYSMRLFIRWNSIILRAMRIANPTSASAGSGQKPHKNQLQRFLQDSPRFWR